MKQYHDLLQAIMNEGDVKGSARPGMPSTKGLFGYQMKFNLNEGFPLLTTKKMNFHAIVVELLWFLKGDTNIKYLIQNGCNIWNQDAYRHYLNLCKQQNKESVFTFDQFIYEIKSRNLDNFSYCGLENYRIGDLGDVYGKQWRSWQGFKLDEVQELGLGIMQGFPVQVDQLKNLIDGIVKNPEGRRHIISAWNPLEIEDMALPPCHVLMQFNCRPISWKERCELLDKTNAPEWVKEAELCDEADIPRYYLDCQMYQRSADTFLGVPFNIASYALLTHIIAGLIGMIPGKYIHTLGDVHIYDNHFDAVNEQLSRDVEMYALPTIDIRQVMHSLLKENNGNHLKAIENILPEHIVLQNYQSYPAIKADLSVGL